MGSVSSGRSPARSEPSAVCCRDATARPLGGLTRGRTWTGLAVSGGSRRPDHPVTGTGTVPPTQAPAIGGSWLQDRMR